MGRGPGSSKEVWQRTNVGSNTQVHGVLGISLYSCLYLKLEKMLCFLLSPMFFPQENQRTRGWNSFCLEGGGSGPNNVYTCK
jgi:hypothetical protein